MSCSDRACPEPSRGVGHADRGHPLSLNPRQSSPALVVAVLNLAYQLSGRGDTPQAESRPLLASTHRPPESRRFDCACLVRGLMHSTQAHPHPHLAGDLLLDSLSFCPALLHRM